MDFHYATQLVSIYELEARPIIDSIVSSYPISDQAKQEIKRRLREKLRI